MTVRRILWTMVLMLMVGLTVYGQAITGRIVGTVQDPSQAGIPGAKVTITNQDTGIVFNFTTDAQGEYVAPSLPAGNYKIGVDAPGFRPTVSADNVVNVAQTTRADLTVQVGSVSEVVEVTAVAPLVRSNTSELGETIDQRQIQSMPLNGRLFSQLVQLTPGTVPTGFADAPEAPAGAGARSPIMSQVNGLTWAGSNFMIDGVSNKEPLNAFISISPPIEAIEEFKVQTNNPSAEYGGFGGATVNLTIRSGTNEFHGSLFEYMRNDALNARTFFAATKAPLRSNQFGGTIGGPIKRNKAFFFFDWQSMRLRLGKTYNLSVPTPLMRQGIFSPSEGFPTIYDPDNGGIPFANNQIQPSRFDSVAAKVANIWPLPNTPTTYSNGPGVNYVENNSQKNDPDQFDVKGDYNFSERNHLFLRESYNKRSYRSPSPGNQFIANGDTNSDSHNHNAVIGDSYIFTARLLNEVRVAFNRFNTFHFGNDYGIAKDNELGIKNGNLIGFPETFGIANFNISGLQQTGAPGWTDALRLANTFQITESVSWTLSNHALKFGVDLMRTDATLTNPQQAPRGEFDFDRNLTSNQGVGGAAFASFLLGYPNRIRRDVVNTLPDVRRYFAGFYANDDWRVTRNLTLNLGVRYDHFGTFTERWNRQSNQNLQDGLIHTATSSNPAPDVNGFGGFSPRVGFAYSPDQGKTAFRGAFGTGFFNDNFGANGGTLERNYPFFQLFDRQIPNQFTPFAKMSVDGLPGFISQPITPTIPVPTALQAWYIPKNYQPDQAIMWNFGIQRQLTHSGVIEVGYVATRGVHLFRNRDIDTPLAPGPGAVNPRRPYYFLIPQISSIIMRSSDGDSHYNALQVKYTKRFSSGLQALLSYTYSKSIDDLSIFWPYNDRMNRGPSGTDLKNNFVGSYSYELPFGNNKHWLAHTSKPVELLAGGWTLNGITAIHGGFPLTVNVSQSLLNTGTGNRADTTCTSVSLLKRVDQWFDRSCYAAPTQLYLFGNSARGSTRGPGVTNFDLSVFKAESLGERRKIEFRAEFFNAFNNPHFSNPNTNVGDANFGRITGTTLTAREIQLGLKFLF